MKTIHILFNGPPGPEGCNFVEVETSKGKSICAGVWRETDNGMWYLDIDIQKILEMEE